LGAVAGYDPSRWAATSTASSRGRRPAAAAPRHSHAADLGELYDALVAHGVPKESLDGMGERFLRMWDALQARQPGRAAQAQGADVEAGRVFDVAL